MPSSKRPRSLFKRSSKTTKQPTDVAWPPLGVRDLPPDVPVRATPAPAGFETLKQALLRAMHKHDDKD